ncbi:MAG: GIY-YIG nuclease family protein [Vicinamibacterales bacterium]
MSDGRRIVYVLKNERNPPSYYTGLTSNLRLRLDAHNAGRCRYTAAVGRGTWTIARTH